MAKLEQYAFEELPRTTDGDIGGFVTLEDNKGQYLFDELRIDVTDQQGTFVRLAGRSMISGANVTVRMSSKADDGNLTISYPDA